MFLRDAYYCLLVTFRNGSGARAPCTENTLWCACPGSHASVSVRQLAPDHVVPGPEECYVYSPLGSAYKLQSYTDRHGKNASVVTM